MEPLVILVIIVGASIYLALNGLPEGLKILLGFLIVSCCVEANSYVNFVTIPEQVNVQTIVDLLFISYLLQEMFTGNFDWRLGSISIVLHAVLIYSAIGFFQAALNTTIPFEIALPIAMYISAFALLCRITTRVKKMLHDYRFWVTLGISVYYLVANFVYYIEWNAQDISSIWWIQQVAFLASMASFSYAFISWHRNRDVVLDISERFLLPNWLFKRLMYFYEDLDEEINLLLTRSTK